MSVSTQSPVSVGVYTALNVSGLTNLASGPYDTEVPQVTTFPCVWFVVSEENARGFGTPTLNQHTLRVHAAATASASQGPAKQLQTILAMARTLLEDVSLTMTGYRVGGKVFYQATTEPVASEIGGKPCWEAASIYYFWVEPTP